MPTMSEMSDDVRIHDTPEPLGRGSVDIVPDLAISEGVSDSRANLGGAALQATHSTDQSFGELVDEEESTHGAPDGSSKQVGSTVMTRTAELVETSDDATQPDDHAGEGNPPRDGDDAIETSGEDDKRAVLARRYAEAFASKVDDLRRELQEEEFQNHTLHPGFVGYDPGNPHVANFQIGTVDDPTRSYGVRMPLQDANVRVNSAIEERRLTAFLDGDALQAETKDSMVQIVAFDPETHVSITEPPGIPIDQVPRSMWTAISQPETLERLRNASVDLANNGITVLENYPIMYWDPERQHIVLGNYVSEVEPDEGEVVPSALDRGLSRFSREAHIISLACPRPETARLIRARTKELYDELVDEPMYLRPLESNMPELKVVTAGRDGARVPLRAEVQDQIVARTAIAEDVPGYPAIRNDEQLLLNGLAHGLSQQKIADAAEKTRDDMVDAAREIREWLGMPDQPSSLYKALLHHSIDISPPEIHVERPILTTNESMHFYLASIGFSKSEAAKMIGVAEGTVKRHRDSVLVKFQAGSMPQAIAHAFACRYYKSFPPAEAA